MKSQIKTTALLSWILLCGFQLCAQTPTLVAHGISGLVSTSLGTITRNHYNDSSFTVTGSAGQTCLLSSFNGGGTGGAGYIVLTGTNAIADGTTVVLTSIGSGYSLAYPLTLQATASSGTATCTGTIGLSGTTGAAQVTLNSSGCTQHCAFVLLVAKATSNSLTTPYDSVLGNVYVQVPPLPQTTPTVVSYPIHEDGDVAYQTWLCMGCTTSSTHSFTAFGNGAVIEVQVWQNGASGPDRYTCNSGTTGNAETGTCTPSNNNEIVVAGVGTCGGSSYTITGGGLTLLDTWNYNGGYSGTQGLATAYTIQTTATPVFANWSTGDGCSATQLVTIYSAASPATLTTTTTSLPEGFVGSAYNTLYNPGTNVLIATGGIEPYTWSVNSGTLPAGLSLAANGTISGTPTTAGTPSLTFNVTDSASNTATTSSITITVASTLLSITSTSCPTGTQYAAYAGCNLSGTGGTVGSGYTYSMTGYIRPSLPEGMVLNTSTGAITSAAIGGMGAYATQFRIQDSLGAVNIQNITFEIAGVTGWMNVGGCGVFPANAIFCHRMDSLPVSTSPADQVNSAEAGEPIVVLFGSNSAGAGYTPNGIPVFEVPWNQATISVTVDTYDTCYFGVGIDGVTTCPVPTVLAPIPPNVPVEDSASCDAAGGGCDQHISVYQQAGGGNPPQLWECWDTRPNNINTALPTAWTCGSNANWTNTSTNAMVYSTSTDISGMPLEPLLLNADEVIGTGTPTAPNGTVTHMTRFTPQNHTLKNYEWPASTATAGTGSCAGYARGTLLSQTSPPASCSNSPAVGAIWRLKASVYNAIVAGTQQPYCVHAGTCPQAAIVLTGLAHYGVIVADNGEGMGVIGTPDSRWVTADLANLNGGYPTYWITESSFEPVNVSSLIVSTNSFQAGTGAGTAPTITSGCPTSTATQGVAYGPFTMTATGTTPITWGVSTPALPSGLTINGATGVISGTPFGGGTSTFAIEATNGVVPNAFTSGCSITVTAVSPNIPSRGIGAGGSIQ